MYRKWGWVADPAYQEAIQPIEGTNAAMHEIEGGSRVVFDSFVREALFYVSDEAQRDKRFWYALNNLQRLRLLYEVLTVGGSGPLKTRKGSQFRDCFSLNKLVSFSKGHFRAHQTAHDLSAHQNRYRGDLFSTWKYKEKNLSINGKSRELASIPFGSHYLVRNILALRTIANQNHRNAQNIFLVR